MCWAIPARIMEVSGPVGKVELSGTVREVGLQLIAEARVGDYVLVHAGFAIQKLDEREAAETLKLFEELFAQEPADDEVR
jgi:hydrogenase expression/formation protein HypC